MRKALSIGSLIAAIALLTALSFSFSDGVYAQGGTATPAATATPATTATAQAATTTAEPDATASPAATTTAPSATASPATTATTTSPATLPSTAEGDPMLPGFVFPLALAILAGAVLFFSLAARRNVER
ncbi:MAG: hypothetical protein HGA45_06655 [Chloroflexales bacterium]|nr:hypothetical protein [Chloroflexales bacterium]